MNTREQSSEVSKRVNPWFDGIVFDISGYWILRDHLLGDITSFPICLAKLLLVPWQSCEENFWRFYRARDFAYGILKLYSRLKKSD